MRFRAFGRTGWQISEIGFGAWQLGGDWSKVDDNASIDTLAEAAMRYVLSAPELSTLIPGMQNRNQVDMNVAYCDGAAFPEVLKNQLPQHMWIRNYYQ